MLQKSDYLILAAALFSMILSIVLWFTGSRDQGVFVGIWVPSILAFGVFLKLALMLKHGTLQRGKEYQQRNKSEAQK